MRPITHADGHDFPGLVDERHESSDTLNPSATRYSPSLPHQFQLWKRQRSESIEAVIKPKIGAYCEIVRSETIDVKAVESIAPNGRSTMFGFVCQPDLGRFTPAPAPDGQLFAHVWLRVGNGDLRLDPCWLLDR